MAIEIAREKDGYVAVVTPPHVTAGVWSSQRPLSSSSLVQELLALGCHQTDIGDAFYTADPTWLDRK